MENLDQNVGNVVEGQTEVYDDIYNVDTISGQSNVDDILAKRGFENEEDEKEDGYGSDASNPYSDNDKDEVQRSGDVLDHTHDSFALESHHTENQVKGSDDIISFPLEESIPLNPTDPKQKVFKPRTEVNDVKILTQNSELQGYNTSFKKTSPSIPVETQHLQLETLIQALEAQKKLTKNANQQAITAEKEMKKLRRNLVKLNADLESAERELEAQRTELERAAARMDKDRQNYKNDKERLERSCKDDIKTLEEEHKSFINSLKNAHNEQISEMESRIRHIEEARVKEGGDIATELSDVIERERETMKKVISLEDERSVFLSQISSLKTQISALESRVLSLQQIADSSTEQEREADMKLDAALSLHARQISQRQSREAELERTIADLSATLVLAKQREHHLMKKNAETVNNQEFQRDLLELKDNLFKSENEREQLKSSLLMEKQKVESLKSELEEIDSERKLEKVQWESQRSEYELKISQILSQLSKVEESQRIEKLSDELESNAEVKKTSQHKKQISSLTEELLHQRNKLDLSTTEVLTLRNRLSAALKRAEVAEAAQLTSQSDFDVERGSVTPNVYGSNIRRRHGIRSRKKSNSIRSALRLDTAVGQSRESLGNFVDTVDHLSLDLGGIFKNDPIARAVFILYLILIHLWSFFLIMFHAQSVEPIGGVGPDQLMKKLDNP